MDGREIHRYALNWAGKYLRYDINAIHSCKREDIFLKTEKILFRRVSATLIATIDTQQFYCLNTLVVINVKVGYDHSPRLVLAILNSKLMNWYYVKFLKSTKTVFSEIQARQVAQLPFPKVEKDADMKLSSLVTQLLSAKEKEASASTEKEKTFAAQRAAALDRQIDTLVYQLYNLTEEEIAIVESS